MKKYAYKIFITELEETIESIMNECDEFLSEQDEFRNNIDILEIENDKFKKEIHDLKESLFTSHRIVCCQEDTIDVLKKQNKQDNLRYNNLFKLLENLKG